MRLKDALKKVPFLQKARIEFPNFLIYHNWKTKKSNLNFSNEIIKQVNESHENGVLKVNKNFSDFSDYLIENFSPKKNNKESKNISNQIKTLNLIILKLF